MTLIEGSDSSETLPAWTRSALHADPHADLEKEVRVRRMFGAIAPRYDFNNRLHSFWQDQRWRRRGAALTAPEGSSQVIDVACGTGDLAEVFHDLGAEEVIGVDFTPEMLEIAKRRAERSQREGLSYVEGDAMALEFPDESADIVSMAFGIRNVADPARALSEFRRILRPAGRLLILEFSEPTNPILRLANRIYTRGVMPLTASLLAGDRSGAYRYLPRSVATFLSRDSLEEAIRDAGFEEVRQVPMCFGVCVAYLASSTHVR